MLGLVQGATEFIPVSSSAHLVLVPWLFGWPEPGIAFDVSLHFGTLLALVAFFFRDWARLGRAGLSVLGPRDRWKPEAPLALGLLVGTIPAAVAGVLLESRIERAFHSGGRNGILAIAAALAAVALLMGYAERRARHVRPLGSAGVRDLLAIGFAQMVALFPGVSRSGSTITAGLFLGFEREAAARLSFLLAAPITAGACAKKALDVWRDGIPAAERFPFAIGVTVAAVSGTLCIAFLLRFLRSRSTMPFIVYRVALGVVLVAVAFTR